MKIKEKFYNGLKIVKKSIEKFPITIICIFVLTLIFTVCVGNDAVDWDMISRIATFIALLATTTYLIETLIKDKNKSQIIYYVLAVIWSALLTISLNVEDDVLGMSNELFIHLTSRVVTCYVISVLILSIYYNFKKSEKTFENYLTGVVVSIFKATFIYGIFAIGLAIISTIFIYLILNGRHYILLGRIEILLLGIYYVPTILYAFYDQEKEIGKFAKNVIKYVLGSLVMIAFAIIYIYILKIFILRNIPSNQIFRIISALFIVGLPIWTMCMSLDEGKTFDKINKKMPLLFIPFIFLQMYSIGVRIGTYGITESRYLCVMLIIFEIIYTIIYIKNNAKIGNNLLVIMAIVMISTVAPFVNMFKVSALSQNSILRKYYQKDDITKEEKNKMYGAYYYLEDSVLGKKYIENIHLGNEDISDSEEYTSARTITIRANRNEDYIEVEGYKKLYNITSDYMYYSESSKKTIDEVFKNVPFEIENDENKIVNVNMLNIVKKYIEDKKQKNSKYKEFDNINETIIVNDNKKIILDYVYITYDEMTNEVGNYTLKGYLLEK